MKGLNEIMEWAASRSRGHAAGALAFSAIHAIGEVGLLSLHPRHADTLVQDTVDHLAAGGHRLDEWRAARVVAAVVRWMEGSRRFPWGDDPARYLKDWRASSALRGLAAELPGTGLMAEEVYGGVLESGSVRNSVLGGVILERKETRHGATQRACYPGCDPRPAAGWS